MNGHESDVVQLRRGASEPANDQLDTAGQTILELIQRAAGVAEENSIHAMEMAQRLSHELRAAEDRVAQLEAEAASCRERAERAEQWLHRVYTEIEERFLRQSDARRGVPQRPQNGRHRSDSKSSGDSALLPAMRLSRGAAPVRGLIASDLSSKRQQTGAAEHGLPSFGLLPRGLPPGESSFS